MSLLDRHAAVILNSDSETNQPSNSDQHGNSETNQRGSSG